MTRVDKTRGELIAVISPYEPDAITYDGVYQSFLEENGEEQNVCFDKC